MIVLSGMGGIAPKITPELLPANMAQSAINAILHKGGVAPLKQTVSVATPTKAGVKKTIFRFGKDLPETQYWFSWTNNVHVCRGPVVETTERTYYTGDGAPKKTDFSLATGSGTSYPMAAYNLGVPAPTTAPVIWQYAAVGPSVPEQRAYVYTNITAWGEESAPSPAAVGTADSAHLLQLGSFAPAPTGAHNIVKRYIYRSVTSSSGTNYYWIGEIPMTEATFSDNVDIASIGEPLATLDWDTPPDDLAGLIALPSGALCGFSGKQVCFSVIGAPYAWPQIYRLTAEYDIVAVAASGQGVFVLTKGYPYFINTGDPASAQMMRIEEEQPCVSARSVVTFQGSVIYASPDGLVSLSQSGTKILTEALFDRETWQAINPSTLFAAKHDNRYYGFWEGGGGFVLDTSGNLTTHDINATAVYVDPVLDQMYLAIGVNIEKWHAGANKISSWHSKRFNLPAPTNFSCAKIKANSYANITLKVSAYLDTAQQATAVANASRGLLIANGAKLTYTTQVLNAGIVRLPSGFIAKVWEFEIVAMDHWTLAAIGNGVGELKGV